jgi:sugar lactone lactonase YvrE
MKTALNRTLYSIAIGLGVSSALLAQPTYTVSTLLGNYSLTDTTSNSPVIAPYAVTLDANGNVYFTDTIGNRVRRVDAITGAVTTVAGDGTISSGAATQGAGGPAVKAKLWQPTGLVFDQAGNLYISDGFNFTIDKVDTNGVFTIFAGTQASSTFSGDGYAATTAHLRNPQRLAMDSKGVLYIADKENNRIRKVNTDGTIHTIAGVGGNATTTGHAFTGDGGPAVLAGIGQPEAVAVDSFGNVYLTDNTNNRVRMVSVAGPTGILLTNSSGALLTDNTRVINTVVGGGSATQVNLGASTNPLTAILSSPAGLAIDSANNVYISDRGNNRILYLNNYLSSCSGTPAVCSTAPTLSVVVSGLSSPSGIALSGTKLYIAETGANRIDVFDTSANTLTTVVQGPTFPVNAPRGLAVNPTSGAVYIADTGNQRIGTMPKAGGSMTVIAGVTGNAGFPTAGGDEDPFNPVAAVTSKVSGPWGGAFDLNGNYYFADKGNNRVRMITPAGVISTIAGGLAPTTPNIIQSKGNLSASVVAGYAGDGLPAVEGQLKSPSAVAVDNVGGTNACPTAPCVYIADTGNNAIRQVSSAGVMNTFAGVAPTCAASLLSGCANLAAGAYGDGLPAVQAFNPTLVTTTTTYSSSGVPTTTTATTNISNLNTPEGVAVDSAGNVYIADTLNHSIRVVNSTTLVISTLVGEDFAESGHAADGLAGDQQFNDSPVAVAVGADNAVYYAEGCVFPATATTGQNTFGQCENSRIRRYDPKTGLTATITSGVTLASLAGASYADGIKSTSALALVPTAVAVDAAGNVYFADATNRIRVLTVQH